jgi:hypothetical protein
VTAAEVGQARHVPREGPEVLVDVALPRVRHTVRNVVVCSGESNAAGSGGSFNGHVEVFEVMEVEVARVGI